MGALSRLKDLEGVWLLDRQIQHADGAVFEFSGHASFVWQGNELKQTEEGMLRAANGSSEMKATRSYIWVESDRGIDVLFEDRRFFHSFRFDTVAAEAGHFCDPDQYDVSYDFSNADDWRSVWRVSGPKKSYTMTSRFRRDDGA